MWAHERCRIVHCLCPLALVCALLLASRVGPVVAVRVCREQDVAAAEAAAVSAERQQLV